MVVAVGQMAPDFAGITDEGKPITARELRGQTTVLYFFPAAFTGG